MTPGHERERERGADFLGLSEHACLSHGINHRDEIQNGEQEQTVRVDQISRNKFQDWAKKRAPGCENCSSMLRLRQKG